MYWGLQIGLSKFHLISSSWEFKPMSIRSKMKKKIPLALMGDSGWDKISHFLSTWDVSGLFSPKPHDSWFYILSPVTGNVFLWKEITHFLHWLWQENFRSSLILSSEQPVVKCPDSQITISILANPNSSQSCSIVCLSVCLCKYFIFLFTTEIL